MKYKRTKSIILIVIIIFSISINFRIHLNDDEFYKVKNEITVILDKKFKVQVNKTNTIKQQEEIKSQIDDKLLIGRIIIPKINLNLPVLEGATEENLSMGITRFYGSKINSIGNCVLAGHNMRDGSLFGKLNVVAIGDEVTLHSSLGISKVYKIFNIKVVKPEDLSVLNIDDSKCYTTLITCTNDGGSRLVLQAEEI